jgi:endonuclease YncB( thermonuclease family)
MRSRFHALALSLAAIALTLPLYAGSTMAKLTSVVDGNTLSVTLRGTEVKVRMHGVVVPPADPARPILQRLNQESVAFLRKYLEDGWVYLEFPSGEPKADDAGLIPAFVYRGSDATFVNEKLVDGGLAIVNYKEKGQFTAQWDKLQRNAEGARRGIWGSFENGGGERIASGVGQGTYIGVPGASDRHPVRYVTYWILLYR